VTFSNCRPQTDKLDVHDTDDEFVIKKPEHTDNKYTDFLDELYKHDTEKQSATPKSKRDTNNPNSFDVYSPHQQQQDPIMEQIVSHLIVDDELKRRKRSILFRYLTNFSLPPFSVEKKTQNNLIFSFLTLLIRI
jgi:hypothetical protein